MMNELQLTQFSVKPQANPGIYPDVEGIRHVHLSAFGEEEGSLIAELVGRLLSEANEPPTMHWIAGRKEKIIAHGAFSPVWDAHSGDHFGFILAPLAVLPEFQNAGVGSRLVEKGLAELQSKGARVVLVYGDPSYYGRFGFSAHPAKGIRAPHVLEYPKAWQALFWKDGLEDGTALTIRCVPALLKASLW